MIENWRRMSERATLSCVGSIVREDSLSTEGGQISEIAREKMQNEYKNNVLLTQMPQFCDKICKSAKGIEKGERKRKVSMFPKQNHRNFEFNKSMNKLGSSEVKLESESFVHCTCAAWNKKW